MQRGRIGGIKAAVPVIGVISHPVPRSFRSDLGARLRHAQSGCQRSGAVWDDPCTAAPWPDDRQRAAVPSIRLRGQSIEGKRLMSSVGLIPGGQAVWRAGAGSGGPVGRFR